MAKPAGVNRRVVLYGHRALRTKSRLIDKLTPELVQFLEDLKVSMLTQDGLGLAANQLGETVAVFAINPRSADIDEEPYCIINQRWSPLKGWSRLKRVVSPYPGCSTSCRAPSSHASRGWTKNCVRLRSKAPGFSPGGCCTKPNT